MQSIECDEKRDILYRKWKAPSPEAVLLLVHGFGGHSARWESLSDFFLKRGISSYAIELRGFGQTSGLRGHVDSFKTYFNDLKRLRDIIAEENPSKKIFLAGESLGGMISFLFACHRPERLSGLLLLSPAFKDVLKYTFWDRVRMLLPLIYNPKEQFEIPFDSKICTRDPYYQKSIESDPMETRLITSRFIFELLRGQARSRRLGRRLKIPSLFLLSGCDKLVDTKASRDIFSGLAEKDKSIIEYKDMYHALSIDLEREKVFEDMFEWIKELTKKQGQRP